MKKFIFTSYFILMLFTAKNCFGSGAIEMDVDPFEAPLSTKPFEFMPPKPFANLVKRLHGRESGVPIMPTLKYVEDLLGRFVHIKGGQFIMGSPEGESYRWNGFEDQHLVELTEYWAGETVLTQETVIKVMHLAYNEPFQNPAYFRHYKYCKGSVKDRPKEPEYVAFTNKHGNIDTMCRTHPAEGMSWDFIENILILMINKLIGPSYRVEWLTEAQIERAHRGLVTIDGEEKARQTAYITGNGFNQDVLGNFYYFYENSLNEQTNERQTYPVKSKTPNNLGIYFASGVLELAYDLFAPYVRRIDTTTREEIISIDPLGPNSTDIIGDPLRSARGCFAEDCRLARRDGIGPGDADRYLGVRLRLVRTSHSTLLPSVPFLK